MVPRSPPQGCVFTRNFAQLCLANIALFSGSGMLFPIMPVFAASMGGSGPEVGLVVSLFALAAILGRAFAARYVDGGFVIWALAVGGLVSVVSSSLYAFTSVLWIVLVLRFIHGLGLASFTIATGAVVAAMAPPTKRGEVVAYFGASQSVGIALAPTLSVALLQAADFAFVFATSAALAVVSLALSLRVRSPEMVMSKHTVLRIWSKEALLPSSVHVAMSLVLGGRDDSPADRGFGETDGESWGFLHSQRACAHRDENSGRAAIDRWGRSAAIVPGLIVLVAGAYYLSGIIDFVGLLAAGAIFGVAFGLANPGLMPLTIDRAKPDQRGNAMGTFLASFDAGIGLGAACAGAMVPSGRLLHDGSSARRVASDCSSRLLGVDCRESKEMAQHASRVWMIESGLEFRDAGYSGFNLSPGTTNGTKFCPYGH